MTKITVQQLIQEAVKEKPRSVNQMHKVIKSKQPDSNVSVKELNQFLYGEYSDDFERCQRMKQFY